MSTHVWEVTTFQPQTVHLGKEALLLAARMGADFVLACRFCGYALETSRQKSSGLDVDMSLRPDRRKPSKLVWFWTRRARTGHRYARSEKNGLLYEAVGRRMLSYNSRELAGMTYDRVRPPEMVWDAMLEKEGLAPG